MIDGLLFTLKPLLLYSSDQRKRGRTRQYQQGVVPRKQFSWKRFWQGCFRFFRWLILVALLIFIVAGPYYGWQYLKSSNVFFTIDKVMVYGDIQYLSHDEVNELVKDAVGQNLVGLDIKEYQNQILQEPWVKSVELKRQWFHQLDIYLTEQQPVAIWNNTQMLNSEGEIFTPQTIPDYDWIYLTGPDDSAKEVLQVYQSVAPQLALNGFRVKEVILDDQDSWSILLDSNLLLIMGTEALDERLARFLRQLPDRNVLDAISHIDFRYKNGFSVKWK